MLVQHADVAGTRVKEPALYSSSRNYSDGDHYLRSVMPTRSAERVLDATPWYAVVPIALERMSAVLEQPRARVVLLMRDPVERAHSMYWDQVAAGRENRSAKEALLDTSGDNEPTDQAEARTCYVWGSRYELHVPRLERAVGASRLLLLSTEHLGPTNLNETWDRLLAFLELAESPVPLAMTRNRATSGPPRVIASLLSGPPGRLLRRFSRGLPHAVRVTAGERLSNAWRGRNRPYPQLDPAISAELALRLDAATAMHRLIRPGSD
jgi:hypothetical protein